MAASARILTASFAILAPLLAVLGLPAPAAAATEPTVDVVAHRGSSGAAPENTLAAVRLAIAQKSDVVENDIQRTLDGELVIMHDTTLARTTDVEQVFPNRAPWSVGDFTLEEIKRLDAGSWFAPEFAGERSLPTFTRALKADRVVVQSFNHAWLRVYKDRAPDVPVGLLYGTRPSEADIAAAATWAQQVNPALGAIDRSTVDQIHAHGMETHVWTVNAGTDMRRAINWQVDGIITNYPQVLIDIVRRG